MKRTACIVMVAIAVSTLTLGGCAEFWDGMYGTPAQPAVPATETTPAQPAKPATGGAAPVIVATASALNPLYGAVAVGAITLVGLFRPKRK